MLGWALLGLASVLSLVAIGYVIGLAVSSPGSADVAVPGKRPSTCAEFCLAWQTSRIAVCNAQNDLRAARAWETTSGQIYLGLLAAAAAFLAASAVAAAIPILGPGIAAALLSAAATLLASAVTMGGVFLGAASAVLTKENELSNRRNEELAARVKVFENCSEAEAATCLATPAPC
jgi:hypothetical protein